MTGARIGYVLATTAGGTGRHVAMLARGCAAAGARVRVFGPAQAAPLVAGEPGNRRVPGAGRDDPAAFEVVAIGGRPRPARDAAAVRRLRRLLMAFGPDVVHAHGLRAGALAALALRPVPPASRLAGRAGGRCPALVVTVHNAPPAVAGSAGAAGAGGAGLVRAAGLARAARDLAVYRFLERVVAARADVVLCVSSDLEARMRRLGAREVGRAVVPAPDARAPGGYWPGGPPGGGAVAAGQPGGATGPDRPAADGRPVVLAVGRLAPQKGLDTLIAAAARWQDRQPRPRLVIAGAGPLAEVLASQAHDADVDVAFLGERADVPELLAAAEVVVLPSRWEGQPLILQEALRAGRPVVASDAGGIPDLAGDDAAVLVPPGDPVALATAVRRVLDDQRLAARLAAAATARAAALPTEAAAVAGALALYRRLAGTGAAGTGDAGTGGAVAQGTRATPQ